MISGVLTLELAIFEARSLKDKRRVIQSVKQRLRNTFNVSVSEVAYLDSPKRCRLAVAMVCREVRPLHAQLDKIVDHIRGSGGVTLVDYDRQLF